MGWLSGWNYRKKITIQGGNLDANQTWFPVYVYLDPSSSGANLGSKIRDDGFDIRFTKSDEETLLYYERESYSEAAGNSTGHFWVSKSDWTINADGTTYIYMYYGKSDATDGSDGLSGNVWDSNFIAVYHLKETPDGTADEIKDSSGTGLHMTGKGGYPDSVTGKIYNGLDCDGSTEYADDSSTSFKILGDLTVSFWMTKGSLSDYRAVLAIEGGSGEDEADNGTIYLDGNNSNADIGYIHEYGSGDNEANVFNTNLVTDELTYLSFIRDVTANTVKCYKNSGLVDTFDYTNDPTCTGSTMILNLGCRTGPAFYWDGTYDELRVSNTDRTAAWQKFEYFNMSETDNELTWLGEESQDININVIEVE